MEIKDIDEIKVANVRDYDEVTQASNYEFLAGCLFKVEKIIKELELLETDDNMLHKCILEECKELVDALEIKMELLNETQEEEEIKR